MSKYLKPQDVNTNKDTVIRVHLYVVNEISGEQKVSKVIESFFQNNRKVNLIRHKNFRKIVILSGSDKRELIYTSSAPLAVLMYLLNRRTIFHYHGTKATNFSGIFKNPLKKIFFFLVHYAHWVMHKLFEFIAKKNSEIVITVSTQEYEYVKNIRNNKITYLLSSYVDNNSFWFMKKKWRKKINIGYLGRITKEKGVCILAKGVNGASNLVAKLSLTHISGLNEHILKQIKNIVKETGTKIAVFENLSESDIVKYLHDQDLVILPSLREQFPLAMLESLSTGTPFIATNVGECGKVLNKINSNLIIYSHSPISIKKKIEWFCSLSSKEKNIIAIDSRKVSEEYSLEIYKKNLSRIFEEIFRNC